MYVRPYAAVDGNLGGGEDKEEEKEEEKPKTDGTPNEDIKADNDETNNPGQLPN